MAAQTRQQKWENSLMFPTQTQEILPFPPTNFLTQMSRRKFIQCVCGNTNKTAEMRKLCHVSNTDPIFLTQVSGTNTDTRNTTFSSHKFPQHSCQGENSSNVFISQDNRNEETLSCFQHRHKKHYIFLFQATLWPHALVGHPLASTFMWVKLKGHTFSLATCSRWPLVRNLHWR